MSHIARMKLVHLISSLKIGGAESMLVDMIRYLPTERYEHTVLYFHDGPNRKQLEQLGVRTIQIRGTWFLYDPFFWWRLYRTLQKIKPDLIHAGLWVANFAARFVGKIILRIPTICVVHQPVMYDGFVRNACDAFTFKFADKIVAVSQDVAHSLQQKKWIDVQKTILVPNGIDTKRVQYLVHEQAQTRAAYGLAQEHVVIGSVGRFVPIKNYGQLIDVFAELHMQMPHARLLLVGVGELEHELRQQAQRLGCAREIIFIVGKQSYGYYPLMDCFVQPSLQEGLSIALLEAMVAGLPCIATITDGTHAVITHTLDGLLIQSGNKKQLYDALVCMMSERKLRVQLATEAKKTVENRFSLDRTISAYQTLFAELSEHAEKMR